MGEVVIFIGDTNLNSSFSRCRICHEEEVESYNFEAPCSCSGTIKFAHRDCIQRWCDEKGNTNCEICLQDYKPGYTTTSKPTKLIEEGVTIRDNLHVARRENGRRRNRRRLEDESEFPECNSDAYRGASCCTYLALFFSVVLLIKHAFDAVYGTEEYPFTIFTVLTLKAVGILLPMLVIIRTIAAIQRSLRYHFLESEEDTLSSEEEDDSLEEEEQQQHLA
ncbi:ring fyve phd zinc finger-containing protein [Arabis alpina]|uniref:Ring fyve phd zinc finger-containing protein n=1 Tax=Arabis alpina TaxID=50452 RepID=A0A087HKG5_ARAAL|nr:ring fyve phd zinc finger-containing protein [Arabis alpina]